MKSLYKKAVGIDIQNNKISFVELENKNGQIKILRSQTSALAEGTVVNGIVQDAAAVASAIKTMKIAGSLKHRNAALTVCGEPVLLQILNMPELSPGQARKFIRDEVRQYAILPLKNVEMDYCGLRSSSVQGKRVLVGAAQSEHLTYISKAIEKENVNIKFIEPAITSMIRVCYDKVIKTAGDKNIMFLLVRDQMLTVCVFNKGKLEFLRTKTLAENIETFKDRSDLLVREAASVMEFYEIETETKAHPWHLIVSASSSEETTAMAGQLDGDLLREDIKVSALNCDMMDVSIENGNSNISPIAVGSAMNLLGLNAGKIDINLLPKEIVALKKARKEMLVIANVAACVFFLLFAYIAFLGKKSANIGHENFVHKQQGLDAVMQGAITERSRVDAELKAVEENLYVIENTLQDRNYQNWAKLLASLAMVVPQTVLIENLQGDNSDTVILNGLAVDYESLNGFVNKLSASDTFASALLADTSHQNGPTQNFINYSISCSIAK